MAISELVQQELSAVAVVKTCCRKAEIATVLRFAGGLHLLGGTVVVEAAVGTAGAAGRLRRGLAQVYGQASELVVMSDAAGTPTTRFVVRVGASGPGGGGGVLARQAGLVDAAGRPVRGLPPRVVTGPVCDAAAVWRGAFLARGSLSEPGRSASMHLTCPGPEAALALVGAARRLGVVAKARQVRGVDRVIIRDEQAIALMLTRVGAGESAEVWTQCALLRRSRLSVAQLANFDDANQARSTRAAVQGAARAARALIILGDQVPEDLAQAGRLRIEHDHLSLQQLGQLADPVLSKDAISGRIRRLVAMADQAAAEGGIEGTEADPAADMCHE